MEYNASRTFFSFVYAVICNFAVVGVVQSSSKDFIRIKLSKIERIHTNTKSELIYRSPCYTEVCNSLPPLKIRICVKYNQTEENLEEESCYPDNHLQAVFDSPLNNDTRPRFELNKRMPGNLVVIIEASVVRKKSEAGEKVIARGVLKSGFLKTGISRFLEFTNGMNQTFAFFYFTKCMPHFYGDNCDKYCKSNLNEEYITYNQMYVCTTNGDRICLGHLGGEYCEEVCKDCCIRGNCSSVNTCDCDTIIQIYYPTQRNIIE